jgi:putative SOS response-associated peptidase YedK
VKVWDKNVACRVPQRLAVAAIGLTSTAMKGMPVILTTRDEVDTWMPTPAEEALKLQRQLADRMLKVVARGLKEDNKLGP